MKGRHVTAGLLGGMTYILASATSGGFEDIPVEVKPVVEYRINLGRENAAKMMKHYGIEPVHAIEVDGVFGSAVIDQLDLYERVVETNIPGVVTEKAYNEYRVSPPFLPTNNDSLNGLPRLARLAATVSGRSKITFDAEGRGKGTYQSSMDDHTLYNEMQFLAELSNYMFPEEEREMRDRELSHTYGHLVFPVPEHWADSVELFLLEAVIQNSLIDLTKEQALNNKNGGME